MLPLSVGTLDGKPSLGAQYSLRRGHWSTDGLVVLECGIPHDGGPFNAASGVFSSSTNGMDHGPRGPFASSNLQFASMLTDASVVSTTAVTVLVVRRKPDTTARAGALFGMDPAATNAQRCGAHVPFSDGKLYWDFGGNAAPNRMTITGLTFSTFPEAYAFTAGPYGSAVWRNGILLSSQGTAVTRTAYSGPFHINKGNGVVGGDPQDFLFVAVLNVQWTPTQILEWTVNPLLMVAPTMIPLSSIAVFDPATLPRPVLPGWVDRCPRVVSYGSHVR